MRHQNYPDAGILFHQLDPFDASLVYEVVIEKVVFQGVCSKWVSRTDTEQTKADVIGLLPEARDRYLTGVACEWLDRLETRKIGKKLQRET